MSPNIDPPNISLAEELVLLLLSEKTGYIDIAPGWQLYCAMAGAAIADLALQGRIDTDTNSLFLVDSSPTEDKILDSILGEIEKSEKNHDTQYWIERSASRSDEIISKAIERLVDRNILVEEAGSFFGLNREISRSGNYSDDSFSIRGEAKTRILNVIFQGDVIPDPRDAILIALMNACKGFTLLLDQEDYEEVIGRIELISKLDLIGRTVGTAVQETAIQLGRVTINTKPIPKARIGDFVGSPSFRSGLVPKGAQELYKKYGAIMKLPFKLKGKTAYAMMGAEANQWLQKHSRYYLRTKEYIRDLEKFYGAAVCMPGSDGADHYKIRKAMSKHYARSVVGNRLPELHKSMFSSLGRWKEGSVVQMSSAFKKYMGPQMMLLGFSQKECDFTDKLMEFQHRALLVKGGSVLPSFMLHTPKMRRYRKYVDQFKELIISSHTHGQRKGEPINWADGIINIHRKDPQLLSEADLAWSFCSNMLVNIYVGSALALAVHCMLRNPDIHERVYREAEKLYGNGRMPTEEDYSPENLDVTARVIMEATRMYPVTGVQVRGVVNQFIYDGYEVPAGSILLIIQTATNYDDTLFKDPEKFDIDRYLPDRAEHKQPGAYSTYGVGPHACLGQRFHELQLAVNIMVITYYCNLELVSDRQKLKVNPIPTATPRKNIKMRIRGFRNPLPSV